MCFTLYSHIYIFFFYMFVHRVKHVWQANAILFFLNSNSLSLAYLQHDFILRNLQSVINKSTLGQERKIGKIKMKFYFEFQERRVEDSVKYSSLESRFLGDVFKSPADSDNINNYDGMCCQFSSEFLQYISHIIFLFIYHNLFNVFFFFIH